MRSARNTLSAFVQREDPRSAPYSPTQGSNTTGSLASYASQPRSMAAQPNTAVKLCCVGDGGVGKTCLLISYSQGRFPEEYIPTVFENYVTNVHYNESTLVALTLWDTAGQEDFDRLRPLSYPETDVVLICFAVDHPPSLDNVEEKWGPEIAHFCEGVPVILVGNKTDLRQDSTSMDLLHAQGRTAITYAEGAAVARRIGATYIESSSKYQQGVDDVFALALKAAMGIKGRAATGRTKRRTKCSIM